MADEEPLGATYNEIHTIVGECSVRIKKEFDPDLMIAIGGGGFFPARIMRSFLKDPARKKNIPIHAIGLALYESLPTTTAEQMGVEVVKTQWLGPEVKNLLGRRVLIVDEVDDTSRTLYYALIELKKDIEEALKAFPEEEREAKRTKFAIFVVHNKIKPKYEQLPADVMYFSGQDIADKWFDYPWEMRDIYKHDQRIFAMRAREAKEREAKEKEAKTATTG